MLVLLIILSVFAFVTLGLGIMVTTADFKKRHESERLKKDQ